MSDRNFLVTVLLASVALSVLVKYALPLWITQYSRGGLWFTVLAPVGLIALVLAYRWQRSA
ncbi:hypothetical protein [Anthocerotibacter panamensis]|uniref:hypothetical protein n=1 Tax=Anthocerotibacter panamensis TaxID=2857077 RepID=UPI001C40428A|nr:hypothetical protein [Anthocerotibacter panamensis]